MLSVSTMEQLCSLASIRVTPCKKTVEWCGNRVEVTGFDVRENGEIESTHFDFANVHRALVHGSEYEHTTFWNKRATFENVLAYASDRALRTLRDKLSS